MKAATILFVFAAGVARCDEFDVAGGLSPDGRYLVRVVKIDTADTGRFVIKDKKKETTIETRTARGYSAASNDTALWNYPGTLVALGEKSSKTTYDTDVYVLASGSVIRIELPDIVQNILGRRHAIARGRN